MKNIGIVCEGPTDYIILKAVIDHITGEENYYLLLQPEPDPIGRYGGGWKGVWKWCEDNRDIRYQIMTEIEPQLDMLLIHMDGDVSRKEKASHCSCLSTQCIYKGQRRPIECDETPEGRKQCPIVLPCTDHAPTVSGYTEHLEHLIQSWLGDMNSICVIIPCDSIETWIVAAYDGTEQAELLHDPWRNVIAKKTHYHDIRVRKDQKKQRTFSQFAETVCSNWEQVTKLCSCAKRLDIAVREWK